jgi:hypothetical protein
MNNAQTVPQTKINPNAVFSEKLILVNKFSFCERKSLRTKAIAAIKVRHRSQFFSLTPFVLEIQSHDIVRETIKSARLSVWIPRTAYASKDRTAKEISKTMMDIAISPCCKKFFDKKSSLFFINKTKEDKSQDAKNRRIVFPRKKVSKSFVFIKFVTNLS